MEMEKETSANTALASESEIKPESEKRLVDLPRLEDLLRSEKEIKSAPKLNGLKRVENNTLEESVEAGEDTMTITMSPRTSDKMVKAYIEPSEENQDVYDTFFTKVYEKNAVAGV